MVVTFDAWLELWLYVRSSSPALTPLNHLIILQDYVYVLIPDRMEKKVIAWYEQV